MDRHAPPLSTELFEAALRSMGDRYHIHHPFQQMMHQGRLDRRQLKGWVANRYYYQLNIPIKDAAILANCPDREIRRHWVQRIIDHDGRDGEPGGIEAWIRLGEAVGLSRDEVVSERHVLPGVRFAVELLFQFMALFQGGIAFLYNLFVRLLEFFPIVCKGIFGLLQCTLPKDFQGRQ